MPTDTTIIDRLRALAHRFEMTATERYEQDAEAFYAETGFMAPGKDVPMAMGGQDEQDRRRAHEAWIQARNEAQKQTLRDAADALTAAHAALAECYRLTGADPDGNEDWRLATNAVTEVKRLREESDAEIAAAHAARDAAEERANLNERMALYATLETRKAGERLTTALRERDEARAAIPRGTGVSP